MAFLLVLLATLTLRTADNGRTFSVAARSAIVLVLPSNATTGYSWRLPARPSGSVLRLVSHRYVAPKSKLPGAGGKEVWRFLAVGKGTARLRLAYVGPGQARKVARRFGVVLRVR
jgi:predicted secreted protein